MNRVNPINATANIVGWSVGDPIWSDKDEKNMESQFRYLFQSKEEYDKFADTYRKGEKIRRKDKEKEAEENAAAAEAKAAAERVARAAYVAERMGKPVDSRTAERELTRSRVGLEPEYRPGMYVRHSVFGDGEEISQEDARQALFELYPEYLPSRDAMADEYAIPPERVQERRNRWAMEHPGEGFTPEKASAEDFYLDHVNKILYGDSKNRHDPREKEEVSEHLLKEKVLLDAEKNGRKRVVRFYEYCKPLVSEPLVDREQLERALDNRLNRTSMGRFLLEILAGYCPLGAMLTRFEKYKSYVKGEYWRFELEQKKCRCNCCSSDSYCVIL